MTVLLAVLLAVAGSVQKPSGGGRVPAALNFTLNDIGGKPVDLAKYQGNVVLMVNVASECGYTPQYAGLQELHKKYAAKGLTVYEQIDQQRHSLACLQVEVLAVTFQLGRAKKSEP